MNAKSFIQTGLEVWQLLLDVVLGQLVLVLECGADFVAELFVLVLVPDQSCEQAGEQVCSRLATSDNEQSAIDNDLVFLQIVLSLLLQDVPDEVPVFRLTLLRKTTENLFAAADDVTSTHQSPGLGNTIYQPRLKWTASLRETARCLLECSDLDCLEDERNPVVELLVLQAAKRFIKSKITDDVKSGEVSESKSAETHFLWDSETPTASRPG